MPRRCRPRRAAAPAGEARASPLRLPRLRLPESFADRLGQQLLHDVTADRLAWRLADLEQTELIESQH
jgi:hypothetical protein